MTKDEAANLIYEDITQLIDVSFRGASLVEDKKNNSWKVFGRFIINFDITFEDLKQKMAKYGFVTVLAGRRYKDTVTFIKNYK
jgi:hypothetical protein